MRFGDTFSADGKKSENSIDITQRRKGRKP